MDNFTFFCTSVAIVLCFILICFLDPRAKRLPMKMRLRAAFTFSATVVGTVVMAGMVVRWIKLVL
ncbi:MAG: hypothetical protein PHE24_06690 [Patescibacteria group bacterium]|nr:hypothetical protein [Patescibacteria group bacterium]